VVAEAGTSVAYTAVVADSNGGDIQATSEAVTITWAATPTPTLTAPAAGTVQQDMAPLLRWTNPPSTTQVQLQIIPANEDGPGIDLIRNTTDRYQVPPPVFGEGNYVKLPGMTYTWRVRTAAAKTSLAPSDSGWSDWATSTFVTGPPTSAGIKLVSPPDGSEVADRTPLVQWSDTDKAVFYYEFQLSKDPGFGTEAFLYFELRHGATTDPPDSYRVPTQFPLEVGTVYYWRVRPRVQGDGKPVAWSNTWSLVTPR